MHIRGCNQIGCIKSGISIVLPLLICYWFLRGPLVMYFYMNVTSFDLTFGHSNRNSGRNLIFSGRSACDEQCEPTSDPSGKRDAGPGGSFTYAVLYVRMLIVWFEKLLILLFRNHSKSIFTLWFGEILSSRKQSLGIPMHMEVESTKCSISNTLQAFANVNTNTEHQMQNGVAVQTMNSVAGD